MDLGTDEILRRFRTASRELYNNHFRAHDEDPWILEERFKEVQTLLFEKMVIEPLDLINIEYGEVNSELLVGLLVEPVSILINREKAKTTGYWDYPIREIASDAVMCFVSFFDWQTVPCLDHQYVLVYINSWPQHPDADGRYALIEYFKVKFSSPL